MKIETTNQLKIKLKQNDADNFKSAIKKILNEKKMLIDFINEGDLNKDELKIIKKVWDKINDL